MGSGVLRLVSVLIPMPRIEVRRSEIRTATSDLMSFWGEIMKMMSMRDEQAESLKI